ncbi:heme lyase CcmF/NrfE family subunit [Candidatus Pelagibacter sp.]|nr:heme lyase CcmF/NrfE family subunit [Candidatus Pelagibacter sp.]
MLNLIGNYSLIFSLILSFLIIFICLKNLRLTENLNFNIFVSTSLQFLLISICFLALLFAFVYSDFSNLAVYYNSHTTKPLFYKISGTWGNHEGSLLLWLLVLSLFNLIFFLNSKKMLNSFRNLAIFFQQIIILGFLLFIIFTSNPFQLIIPTPIEGLGLNPILQDPALAIHPPILYLGYVGSSIIFSSSLAALICGYVNKEWAKDLKKWTLISWVFLTLGIMLGSVWAYYELGWGGFWFWDPVENVSLMPWFCLTALLHCTSVLEKRTNLQSWTIILALCTFTLSMSGTFLVRSGILNSIHTFANDPERGVFILIFLFVLIISALIIFFKYSNFEKESNSFILSKETSIVINNWFMMYFLAVVLIGTIYPIFLEVLTTEKISVGPPYFNQLIVPLLIPFLFFMSFGPKLDWIKNKKNQITIKKIILFILSILISFFIVKHLNTKILYLTILMSVSVYLFFVSIIDLKNKKLKISQKISHLAFSILIISILMNSLFSEEASVNLNKGEQKKVSNYLIKFNDISKTEIDNYTSLRAEIEVASDEKELTFYPELRLYKIPETITSEADIKTNLFNDNLVVVNYLKDTDYLNIRYQKKPFMLLIWLSAIMLAVGGLLGLRNKFK